jgi:hypothetical protein
MSGRLVICTICEARYDPDEETCDCDRKEDEALED